MKSLVICQQSTIEFQYRIEISSSSLLGFKTYFKHAFSEQKQETFLIFGKRTNKFFAPYHYFKVGSSDDFGC